MYFLKLRLESVLELAGVLLVFSETRFGYANVCQGFMASTTALIRGVPLPGFERSVCARACVCLEKDPRVSSQTVYILPAPGEVCSL